jgi:hypothetical protein
MIPPIFNAGIFTMEVAGKSGKGRKKGWQDITRTRFSPKAAGFQRFGAGASVGARAARKKKTKVLNERSAPIGLFRPESAHP